MTCPAALKMKLTIKPIRLGKKEVVFLPISFRPLPTALIPDFKAVIILSTTAPMTKLAEEQEHDLPLFLGNSHVVFTPNMGYKVLFNQI